MSYNAILDSKLVKNLGVLAYDSGIRRMDVFPVVVLPHERLSQAADLGVVAFDYPTTIPKARAFALSLCSSP